LSKYSAPVSVYVTAPTFLARLVSTPNLHLEGPKVAILSIAAVSVQAGTVLSCCAAVDEPSKRVQL